MKNVEISRKRFIRTGQ